MNKKIIVILLVFLLIPLVTAGEFSIEIRLYGYVKGQEIIWTPDVTISAISFEIIGVNHNEKFRILNLTIIDASPLAFKNSLSSITQELRIKQTKTLWISQIIDINQFNQTNIDFWIGVEGILEGTNEVIYNEEHLNVTLVIPENRDGFISSFGEKIWEGDPTAGIFLVGGGILVGGFLIWKYKGSDKLDEWREKSERKRVEQRNQEEGFY